MDSVNILNQINIIAEKIIKSVESQVYEVLDKIMIIGPELLKEEPLKKICPVDQVNGIILIASAFILFYAIYFGFTQMLNLYKGNCVENVYKFIMKSIIIGIMIHSSYFLCSEILNLFGLLTSAIDGAFENVSGSQITFTNLKEVIMEIDDLLTQDVLSLNGMIKGMISFGFVSILIHFSIRYVTILFLIIVSPFAFVSLASNLTSGIFESWIKTLITNLFVQIVVKFMILIPITYKDTNSILYKIILVGSIYLIYQVNHFTKEIFSKITGHKNMDVL